MRLALGPIPLLVTLSFPYLARTQCNTAGYVPCYVPSSSGSSGGGGGGGYVIGAPTLPPAALSGGGASVLSSAAEDPTQGDNGDGGDAGEALFRKTRRNLMARDIAIELEKRQNALCCRPAPVQCRVIEQYQVPYCYDPSDTRWFFSDGSYYFQSNETYYGSDHTVIDYQTGDYSFPNGTTGNLYGKNGSGSSSPSSSSAGASPTSSSSTTAESPTKSSAAIGGPAPPAFVALTFIAVVASMF